MAKLFRDLDVNTIMTKLKGKAELDDVAKDFAI
jgi:hypothetical protein